MSRRVKYNRGSLDSTIAAAVKVVQDAPLYVFATAYGFTIDRWPPPGGQRHVVVTASGVEYVESRFAAVA